MERLIIFIKKSKVQQLSKTMIRGKKMILDEEAV